MKVLHFVCWMLANVMYRLKVTGRENIPVEGPAVLVCNHVSFVDWMVIGGVCPRPVRFVMHYSFLQIPFAGRFFRDAKVIPVADLRENSKVLRSAFNRISKELRDGEVVCIFPEGKLTENGEMNPFRRGIERIVKNDPVPVIPIALHGLWGSFFSKANGKPMSRPFRRMWSRISLIVGEPMPAEEVSCENLKRRVQELLYDTPA